MNNYLELYRKQRLAGTVQWKFRSHLLTTSSHVTEVVLRNTTPSILEETLKKDISSSLRDFFVNHPESYQLTKREDINAQGGGIVQYEAQMYVFTPETLEEMLMQAVELGYRHGKEDGSVDNG